MNKRGFNFVIVGLIVVVLVIFILIFLTGKIGYGLSDVESVQECRSSAYARASTRFIFPDSAVPTFQNLECKTNQLEIREAGVFKNGREMKGFEFNKDNIQRVVANEMYDCWLQFGEGKIQPFGKELVDSDSHCVICSRIEFSEEEYRDAEDKKIQPKLNKFTTWLHENKVGQFGARGERTMTYYEFLTRYSPLELARKKDQSKMPFVYTDHPNPGLVEDEIDMRHVGGNPRTYYVVFASYVEAFFIDRDYFMQVMTQYGLAASFGVAVSEFITGLKDEPSVVQLVVVASDDWDDFTDRNYCQKLY